MTLKKRYDAIMDRIEVTDEMRARILQSLQQADLEPSPKREIIPFSSVRKYLSLAACFVILLFGALTVSHLTKSAAPNNPEAVLHGSGIVEVSSAEALSDAVGYTVSDVKGLPFEVLHQTYTAYWGDLAEIQYFGAEQTAVFRVSLGKEDNSGDYTQYPVVQACFVGTVPVTLKGNADRFTLAIWCDGTYSYSLNVTDGLTAPEWEALIGQAD